MSENFRTNEDAFRLAKKATGDGSSRNAALLAEGANIARVAFGPGGDERHKSRLPRATLASSSRQTPTAATAQPRPVTSVEQAHTLSPTKQGGIRKTRKRPPSQNTSTSGSIDSTRLEKALEAQGSSGPLPKWTHTVSTGKIVKVLKQSLDCYITLTNDSTEERTINGRAVPKSISDDMKAWAEVSGMITRLR